MSTPTRDLLIEIGTEELPPKALAGLSSAFEAQIQERLDDARLKFAAIKRFATPRRLALLVSDLEETQEDNQITRFGPAVKAAFDKEGNPTRAATGFASSCGVDVAQLGRAEKDGVEKLSFEKLEKGRPSSELLPEILTQALAQLPIPKRMRWGASRVEFVRPVHWVVLLFGEQIIPATILGVDSGSETRGHRFLHNDWIPLKQPSDYQQALEETGKVIADFTVRLEMIREQVTAEAKRVGGEVMWDEGLLQEIASLVEYPVALTGEFDPIYLELPPETLVLTMKSHQKCFCLADGDGNLLPRFITVSNLISKDPARVVEGNERVIRPRLADARFFFETDKKTPLADRREQLKALVFQDKLGTVYDKSQRVADLAQWIAQQLDGNQDFCRRAAELSKCDLLTQMVGEFADLQGLMGYYYARHDGEPDEVASALTEQYQPRHAGADLPETLTGSILAIADKLDTMVGLFGIGQPPTGSKDPFALRRAAIGILRILVEKELPLDMQACIAQSLTGFAGKDLEATTEQKVFDFMLERFRAWYADEGIGANIFQAVSAVRPVSPLDFHHRVQAVARFTGLPEAEALAAANKRVSNLLGKQTATDQLESVQKDLLSEAAEQELARALASKVEQVTPLFSSGNYSQGLAALAELKMPVDKFFDEVLVMAEDPAVQANRLALLKKLRELFLRVADISHLHSN